MAKVVRYHWNGYIHPKNGGDDIHVSGIIRAHDDNQKNVHKKIKKILKNDGCAMCNDYVITAITTIERN